MTLNEDAETMGTGDGHADRPAADRRASTPKDINSVYYFALFPNALVSLHPDYFMLHTLWPRAGGRTEVTCEWFFEPETMARRGLRPQRRGRLLGHGQQAGLARLRADPARRADEGLHGRPLRRPTSPTPTPSTRWSPGRYMEALRATRAES